MTRRVHLLLPLLVLVGCQSRPERIVGVWDLVDRPIETPNDAVVWADFMADGSGKVYFKADTRSPTTFNWRSLGDGTLRVTAVRDGMSQTVKGELIDAETLVVDLSTDTKPLKVTLKRRA